MGRTVPLHPRKNRQHDRRRKSRRKADPDFDDRCEAALDTAEDTLEAELMRRALEGEQAPVYFKGEVVGHTSRKSDALLVFAIRNLRRRRERDVPKRSALRQWPGL